MGWVGVDEQPFRHAREPADPDGIGRLSNDLTLRKARCDAPSNWSAMIARSGSQWGQSEWV